MSEFIHVEPVRYWCHKILPLVYDGSLSYMELLNKVVYKLNEVVNNNNELPAYIAEQIKNYINSGEIKKVVQDILANYSLNVKFPPEGITPAVGDGTVDDTAAFQGCLDYAHAHGGMMVFVPAGKYLCGNLTMYSGCSIKGDGRYDTTIVMRGGVSNPFIGGELDAVQIADIGIDGNADIQVNNIDVFNVKLSNALLTNLFITDGYTLLKIQENGGDIQIDNVVFDKAVVRAVDLIKGVSSRVQMNQVICRNVSKLNGESAIRIGTDGGFYDSIISIANAPTGIEVTGSDNYIQATVVNATVSCNDTGENNNIKIVGENTNENVRIKKTVTAGSIEENITGNKQVNTNSIFVNTNTPIKYSKPTKLNKAFNVVPMIDKDNKPYNLLTEGENVNAIGNTINFSAFGAVGDGITDDTEAIKAAISYAIENNRGIMDDAPHVVSDTIVINNRDLKTVIMRGVITPTFKDKPVVVFDNLWEGTYEAHVIGGDEANGGYTFASGAEFGELPFKGIVFKNSNHCHFTATARNCNTGVSIEGDADNENDGGNAYNIYFIPDVGDNAINLDIMAKNKGGWVNENLFLDFSIQTYSSNQNESKTTGVRMWTNGSTNGANQNMFIKPSFQTMGRPILIKSGSYNVFTLMRFENNTPNWTWDSVCYVEEGVHNEVDIGYSENELYSYGKRIVSSADSGDYSEGTGLIKNKIGRLVCLKNWTFNKDNNAVVLNSNNAYLYSDDIDFYNPYDPTKINGQPSEYFPAASSADDGWTIPGNYWCGYYVDVSVTKDIYFVSHCDSNVNAVSAAFFDADNKVITPTLEMFDGWDDRKGNYFYVSGNTIQTTDATKANNVLQRLIIRDNRIKTVFVGTGNPTKLKWFAVFGNIELYKINTPIVTKRLYGTKQMIVSNGENYKGDIYVGKYVPTVKSIVSTDDKNTYYTKGFYCTAVDSNGVGTWIEDKIAIPKA